MKPNLNENSFNKMFTTQEDESRSHEFLDQRCRTDESVQSGSRNARDSPPYLTASVSSRAYMDDDDGFRISTNVTVLKMLLLFAAISLFSVGAFAVKVNRELIDLRTEYDLMLNGIQFLQSTSSNSASNYSNVANLLLSDDIHEFNDEMMDGNGYDKRLRSSNHGFDEVRKDNKSFVDFVSCISRHFKDNTEDAKKSIEFLFAQCKLHEEKVDKLTKELENTKAYLHLAFAMMNHKNSLVDKKKDLHESESDRAVSECESAKTKEIEMWQKAFQDKELMLLRDNFNIRKQHQILQKQLHNTTSFLHLAMYIMKEERINCETLVDENDFLYEVQEQMSRERADFHKKIEKLTEENLALMEDKTNVNVIQNDDNGEKDHLRRSLRLTAVFLHFAIYYIRETSSNYEDLLGQNEFIYTQMERMGNELNITRACVQMHPNPQWDNVKLNAKPVPHRRQVHVED